MRCLVTGATGYIGSRLCAALINAGIEVRAVSRRAQLPDDGIEYVRGDIESMADPQIFAGIDVVIHCASELKDIERMYKANVGGTRNLLRLLSEYTKVHSASVHWIQLSSVGVYGAPPQHLSTVVESSPRLPRNAYEFSKAVAEELVVSARSESFSYTLLQPSTVIGAGMPNPSFFALAAAVKNRHYVRVGTVESVATYVTVDDLIKVIIICVRDFRARNQTFIISNDCSMSAVIQAIARHYDVAVRKIAIPLWLVRIVVALGTHVRGFPLSPTRLAALTARVNYSATYINEKLDFNFVTSIPDAIPSILDEARCIECH